MYIQQTQNTLHRRLGNPGCDKWMLNNGNRPVSTIDGLPKEVVARLTTSHHRWSRVLCGRGIEIPIPNRNVIGFWANAWLYHLEDTCARLNTYRIHFRRSPSHKSQDILYKLKLKYKYFIKSPRYCRKYFSSKDLKFWQN